jgi:biotin synthase
MAHSTTDIESLFDLPFNDLILKAQTVHRQHFNANEVQVSTLLSIKTGGCSEDCGYCSQSARNDTGLESGGLMSLDEVIEAATAAKARGASRFCMGAAWRGPKDRDIQPVKEMITAVNALGLETCVTLGMLKEGQAEELADAGLDYYNHNIDTDPEYYDKIITTHTFDDRIDTLHKVRDAGIKVCCGGIVGLAESRRHRAGMLAQLAAMDPVPDSVPINMLVRIPGTPVGDKMVVDNEGVDPLEFVRTIAVARIVLPQSVVRLSAGREAMPDYLQALCFLAGANSIFYGDKLLTTGNPDTDSDQQLFKTLGIKPMEVEIKHKGECRKAS